MSNPHLDIEAFALDFRTAIEPCWGPDTGAHSSDLFPEGYEVPPSGGQCVVTSAVLLGELRQAFPAERFRLTVGAVYLGRAAILGHHTYVTHHPLLGRSPNVIDVTGDQAPGIDDKVVFGGMQELVTVRGLAYLAFNQYEEPPDSICEDMPGNTPKRMAILRERLGSWRKSDET